MERSATEQRAKFYPQEDRIKFWAKFPSKIVDVEIKDADNNVIFEMNLTAPANWSDNSLRVIASRYVHPFDKSSIFRMVDRVCITIAKAGLQLGYFANHDDVKKAAREFYEDLYTMVIEQKGVWNSPVWFNVGLDDKPQVWACLIAELTDEMGGDTGIGKLWETEWRTYKGGSGLGTNYGSLRGEGEFLAMKKGQSSGAMSFIRGSDTIAGTIKSGGKNRRAAKMNVMDIDHPDIVEFIQSKAWAEGVARVLMDAGYDVGMNGKHSFLVPYQNANHSVRMNGKEFFAALDSGEDVELRWRSDTDRENKKISAADLWEEITEAAWVSADPGLQFDDHIQSWHTTPSRGLIRASNPCSEYLSNDDTVCNLASINQLAYWHNDKAGDPVFDVNEYIRIIKLLILSQDILVSISSYPKDSIEKNVLELRQLGLGFANAGALLMWLGLPYDSDAGRSLMASLQYLMQAVAARRSAELARDHGPHGAWAQDGERHRKIMRRHSVEPLSWRKNDEQTFSFLNWYALDVINDIWNIGESEWAESLDLIDEYGLRNAQLTVIAPTGTISFLMGCETQGIEPFFSFSAIKTLVGGGELDLSESSVVVVGLSRLKNFVDNENANAATWINNHPLFATAMGPENILSPEAHVLMMGCIQPSVSGAISKTANLPNDATREDIANLYQLAWEVGCKAIAIYRDGSKFTQPLNVKKTNNSEIEEEAVIGFVNSIEMGAVRRPMPWTRKSTTHKFRIGAHSSFYLTAGFYEDGSLGEIFYTAGAEGTFTSGILGAFAKAVSIGLQYGIPLNVFAESFIGKAIFEPNGVVVSDNQDPALKFCDSVIDYTFKWLTIDSDTGEAGTITWGEAISRLPVKITLEGSYEPEGDIEYLPDPCPVCGRMKMVPNGTCALCMNCGETTGCS